jgi:serine/threonine-protein kinase HipA
MWPQISENEDLTMRLAKISGMEVPLHGMVYAMDQSLVYFIARFDRYGRTLLKIPVEDFTQLLGESRLTKYSGSMEQVIQVIERYCTFPVLEKSKLFARKIFNFLVGNEDMHLKNFSLITDHDVVRLAPVYDFLNSTIVEKNPEEMALPLNGKKKNISRRMLVQYFGVDRLDLESKVIDEHLQRFSRDLPMWFSWIERSFLRAELKAKYRQIVERRAKVLGLV